MKEDFRKKGVYISQTELQTIFLFLHLNSGTNLVFKTTKIRIRNLRGKETYDEESKAAKSKNKKLKAICSSKV